VQWRRLAEAARARAAGVDEYLARYERRLVPAKLVHHIVPADEDPARRLDPANLVVLSPAVHRRVHDAYEAGPAEKRAMQALLAAIRVDSEEVNPHA
jgi:5-methylcytosine-specific restriction endonuclease McrA